MKLLRENAKFFVAILTALGAYAATEITDASLATLITAVVGAVIVWLTPNQEPT